MATSISSSFQQIADILIAFSASHTQPPTPFPSQPTPPPQASPLRSPSLDLHPLLNSISSLNTTLASLLPLIPPTSSLPTIQTTLSRLPTSTNLSSIHLSLQREFSKLLTDLHTFIPSASNPQITNLFNMCLTNFSGHILSRTTEMLTRVVAITKGKKFESPTSHAPVLACRPTTAAGPSAAGSSSSLPYVETPPAPSPADPSTKVSLQNQKKSLSK